MIKSRNKLTYFIGRVVPFTTLNYFSFSNYRPCQPVDKEDVGLTSSNSSYLLYEPF